jgi:putative heme-binding domain-containing protein
LLDTLARSALPGLPPTWIEGLKRMLSDPDVEIRMRATRAAAVLKISALSDALARTAQNENEPVGLRLEAIRALARIRPVLDQASLDFLIEQLRADDSLLRLAASEILRRTRLNETDKRRSIAALAGQSLIDPSVFQPASVDRPPVSAETRVKIDRFTPLLEGGDSGRGRSVFFGPKAGCSACHAISGNGGNIGPDLTKLGVIRSGRDILESIVAPSATMAQGYETFRIRAIDDQEASGTIIEQSSDSVLMRDSSGAATRYLRQDIRSIDRHALSLMPEGLEQGLSELEFRDLLAYLRQLGTARGGK